MQVVFFFCNTWRKTTKLSGLCPVLSFKQIRSIEVDSCKPILLCFLLWILKSISEYCSLSAKQSKGTPKTHRIRKISVNFSIRMFPAQKQCFFSAYFRSTSNRYFPDSMANVIVSFSTASSFTPLACFMGIPLSFRLFISPEGIYTVAVLPTGTSISA